MQKSTIDLISEAAESLQADKALWGISFAAASAVEKWKDAQETLTERNQGEFQGGAFSDSFLVEALIWADVRIKFWARVVAASSPSKDEPTIDPEVLKSMVTERARSLVNNWGGSSTSIVHNAVDSVEREFNSRLVRDFGSDLTIGEVSR